MPEPESTTWEEFREAGLFFAALILPIVGCGVLFGLGLGTAILITRFVGGL